LPNNEGCGITGKKSKEELSPAGSTGHVTQEKIRWLTSRKPQHHGEKEGVSNNHSYGKKGKDLKPRRTITSPLTAFTTIKVQAHVG